MLPSLRAVRAFTAVAREGSFERAGAQLGISRSAVSHLIGDLERLVGVRLLERNRRGAALTDAGKSLLLGVEDAVLRIEAAFDALRVDRSSIRLSTVATFASCWLLPRLPKLQALHPNLQLAISTTTHAVDLSREEADCAIRHGAGTWPGLESTLLFKDVLVLAGCPRLLRTISPRSPAQSLRSVPIIEANTRRGDLARWWQANGFEGPPPRVRLVVQNRAQAVAAANAGSGLTIIDPRFIPRSNLNSSIQRVTGRDVVLDKGYYFVVPHRHAERSDIKALRAWLSTEAENPIQ